MALFFEPRQRLDESLASFSVAEISSKQLCAGQSIELAHEFIEAGPLLGVRVLSGASDELVRMPAIGL
ncbi:hypothetical protein PMIT1303_02019 [Prochlorococcus sp. MIT 1303]|nr:hypothetical protein PMIT1303_02019 [Prochlorococcus sp. MIT 1303]